MCSLVWFLWSGYFVSPPDCLEETLISQTVPHVTYAGGRLMELEKAATLENLFVAKTKNPITEQLYSSLPIVNNSSLTEECKQTLKGAEK